MSALWPLNYTVYLNKCKSRSDEHHKLHQQLASVHTSAFGKLGIFSLISEIILSFILRLLCYCLSFPVPCSGSHEGHTDTFGRTTERRST